MIGRLAAAIAAVTIAVPAGLTGAVAAGAATSAAAASATPGCTAPGPRPPLPVAPSRHLDRGPPARHRHRLDDRAQQQLRRGAAQLGHGRLAHAGGTWQAGTAVTPKADCGLAARATLTLPSRAQVTGIKAALPGGGSSSGWYMISEVSTQ